MSSSLPIASTSGILSLTYVADLLYAAPLASTPPPCMTSAAAAPTSLLRPGVTTAHAARASATAPTNRVHLGNLEHLFRNRGAAETSGTAAAAPVEQPARRRQQASLLRLPSFFKRAKGDSVLAKENPVDLSPRLFQPVPPDGPSPRGDIAASWRRLHGEDGWRGLLDPLHPDLRCGEFVDAAYGAFLSQSDAAPGDRAAAVHVPLQDAAYRVTAPLFVTSSVGLPPWLALAAPCAAQHTSLVGYVAVCGSPAEVRRMGRRDIFIVGIAPREEDHDLVRSSDRQLHADLQIAD